MPDRMERLALLPFTMGCITESSIALNQAKRSKPYTCSTPRGSHEGDREVDVEKGHARDEENLTGENVKSPSSLPSLSRLQKFVKNLKNFPHLFAYKDELDESDSGMEIGLPTDVKHVTHIGLDGCASSILSNGLNDPAEVQELMNFSSLSFTSLDVAYKKSC